MGNIAVENIVLSIFVAKAKKREVKSMIIKEEGFFKKKKAHLKSLIFKHVKTEKHFRPMKSYQEPQ